MLRTSIGQTRQEVLNLVLPEHANVQGNLFGGRMMYWIVSAATLAALRAARGSVVLGSMDDLDFLAPVRVGDLVILRAQLEHTGRASMEVGVEVEAETPRTGERKKTTSAHLAMVAVDENGRPRPLGVEVAPNGPAEARIAEAARLRKAARDKRLADREARSRDGASKAGEDASRPSGPSSIDASRLVFPEDAAVGKMMFAGTLLLQLDEFASIVAVRYARGFVVTASLDALDFYAPLWVGNIVTYQAAINYVGRTSMEIGVRVSGEDPRTGERRHTCTAYMTSVHMGPDGRPVPLPPFTPKTPVEQRRWREAETRRVRRQERRQNL